MALPFKKYPFGPPGKGAPARPVVAIPQPAVVTHADLEPRFFKLGDGSWAVRAHGAPPAVGDVVPVRRANGVVAQVVVTSLVTRGDRVKHEPWVARTEEASVELSQKLLKKVATLRKPLGFSGDRGTAKEVAAYVAAVDDLIGKLTLFLK